MKTSPLLIAVSALCLATLATAADSGSSFSLIKTNSGKVYTNCRIFKTDPDGVMFSHQHGGAKVLFVDMPEETRNMLGYDAKKAAEYEKDRAEQKKKEREELWKYRNEVAKAQTAAYNAEARRMELMAVQGMAGGYGGYGGYGYGYGLDPFGGFGYGYGLGYPYGFGYGTGVGLGHRFGFSPLHCRFPARNITTLLPKNSGIQPVLGGVIGRPGFAPVHCPTPPRATPAMGALTPALGGGGRP